MDNVRRYLFGVRRRCKNDFIHHYARSLFEIIKPRVTTEKLFLKVTRRFKDIMIDDNATIARARPGYIIF